MCKKNKAGLIDRVSPVIGVRCLHHVVVFYRYFYLKKALLVMNLSPQILCIKYLVQLSTLEERNFTRSASREKRCKNHGAW